MVLSSALMGGMVTLTELKDKQGISADSFALPAHRTIWRAMEQLKRAGETIDPMTVSRRLDATKQLNAVGGHAGLMDVALCSSITTQRARTALELVTDATKRRVLAAFASEMINYTQDGTKRTEEALEYAERGIVQLRDKFGIKNTPTIKTALREIADNLEWRIKNPGAIRGLSTGFRRLDTRLDGLQPGAMLIIAARPGIGKTAALMNILTNICLRGTPVGMFSLEMPTAQLMERILYGMAEINADEVRLGKQLTMGQQQAFLTAMRKIQDAPLHIDDDSSLTIDTIMSRGRRMVREHGVKVIGVDYLQLARSGSQQARQSREREVSEISAGLKAMAKELNIPVIVLAQLNRESEKRAGKSYGRPQVSDLRDSGSIEQDADQIILLNRPYVYAKDDKNPPPPDFAEWIIGKNRFGKTGNIDFTWKAEYTRYTENVTISIPKYE